MKKRYGFVANSSSTSFYCDICNSYQEYIAGYQCPRDHVVCHGHTKDGIDVIDDVGDGVYSIQEKDCPICNMDIITKEDLDKYMKRQYNLTTESLKREIRNKFGSGLDGRERLSKYLKEE